jgi:ketosteroid isomerase-like protein
MSEQDNIRLTKTWYNVFVSGDTQAILDLVAEDLDFQHPMPHAIWTWAGKRRGRTGLAEAIVGLNATIE